MRLSHPLESLQSFSADLSLAMNSPALRGGLSSRAIAGESGPLHLRDTFGVSSLELDAKLVHDAIEGLGTNTSKMLETLFTLNDASMAQLGKVANLPNQEVALRGAPARRARPAAPC